MTRKELYTGAGIYQFTCNITGMKYVGKSKKCKKRYGEHVAPSSKNGSKSIISGGDYTYDILEKLPLDVSDELLADREQYWMEQVPSEFLVNILNAKFIGHKIYNAANKDKKTSYNAAYNAANKDKSNEKNKCDCGGKYTHDNKSKHIKSKKHIDYIESNI